MSHGTNVELAWRDLGIEIEKLQEECRGLMEQVARFRSLDTVADLIQKAESLEADRDRYRDLAEYLCRLKPSVVVPDEIASRFPDPLVVRGD